MPGFTPFCVPRDIPYPRRAGNAEVLPLHRPPRTAPGSSDWRSILVILLTVLLFIILIWLHYYSMSKLFGPISRDKMPKYRNRTYNNGVIFLTSPTPPYA